MDAKWKRRIRRLFMLCAGLAILAVIGMAALVGSIRIEHGTEITLPVPTGPFAVGRTIADWKDDATVDLLAPVSGTRRELLVWIWYPSAASSSTAVDDYLPGSLRPKTESPQGPAILTWLTRDLSKVHAHSAKDTELSTQQQTYPVVIMRAGASAPVMNYTSLAEDLASHGYVVVAFDAPYRTGHVVFPDGRTMDRTSGNNPELVTGEELVRRGSKLLSAWTTDARFVVDRLESLNTADNSGRFTGHLDMTRIGIFGHSLGGATAAQFCHDDSRCKAGIDIDGRPLGSVIHEGIAKPFMFLLSSHGDGTADAETRQILADVQSIYDHLPADGRPRLTIRGANHFTFSDDGALLKSRVMRGVLRLSGMLSIDGRRQLEVTRYCIVTFFDTYLKGEAPPPARFSSTLYPELEVFR